MAASTSKRTGSRGVPRAERESQILDQAADEFARHGYAGTSVAAIARRSDISKPLVYSYFTSKNGLYIACLDRAARPLVDELVAVRERSEPGLSMATDALTSIFTVLEDRRNDWLLLYDVTLPPSGPATEIALGYRAELADLARRGVELVLEQTGRPDPRDVSAMTAAWLSVIDALVGWWISHPDESVDSMAARCARFVAALA